MDEEIIEDRGDNHIPLDVAAAAKEAETKAEEATDNKDEEVKTDETPRGPDGKFAKKERDDDEVRIPKSRFDEQVAKERERAEAAERRLAEYEARLKAVEEKAKPVEPPVASKIDELEEKALQLHKSRDTALADGDLEKAAELLKEVRKVDREISRLETETVASAKTAESDAARKAATEVERVDAVVSNLQDAYSVLKDNSEDYNPRLVEIVLAEQSRLISDERMSPSQALAKAGKDIMEMFGHKPAGEEKAEKPDTKTAETERRRIEALKSSVEASKKQPGSLKDVGMDSDKAGKDKPGEMDPNKLSYKEFNALPADVLARMRGDFV